MYVLSHGSGQYCIVVHYCMVYSTIAPSRSDDAIMQCDGAIWCKDVMVRWRDSATVRWLLCNDVVVRWRWHGGCSSALVMVRWCDSAMVMVQWRGGMMAMVRWYDDAMTRWCERWRTRRQLVKRCFVVSSSRSALSRHLIALSRFLYSCAVCKKIMASDMLIVIRQILDRVLSIPDRKVYYPYLLL